MRRDSSQADVNVPVTCTRGTLSCRRPLGACRQFTDPKVFTLPTAPAALGLPCRPQHAAHKGTAMKTRTILRWLPLGLAVATLALVVLVVDRLDIDPGLAMRDMAATADVHPLTGVISNLGVLLWWAAAAICGFSAFLCNRMGDVEGRRFFAGACALTAFLAIDDFFMLHDYLVPTYLHIGNKVVTLGIAIAALVFIALSVRPLLRSRYGMFLLAGALLATSLLIDDVFERLVTSYLGTWRIALEDGFKFAGAACWLAYFSEAAFDRITRPGGAATTR
jgi:hypothetical protein